MKKLLVILGVFDVSVVSPNLLTSCVIKPIISQIDNGIDYQGDLRILNEITKKISTMLQKYAIEKTLIDINDYSIQEFEKLFTMMTSNKTQEELKLDDKNIAAALNALVNGFMAVFNNVNRDVANQYSNY